MASTEAPVDSFEDVFDSALDVGDVSFDFSVDALVEKMVAHFNAGLENQPVDLSQLPSDELYKKSMDEAAKLKQIEEGLVQTVAETPGPLLSSQEPDGFVDTIVPKIQKLAPEGVSLGSLHHSSRTQYLTEKEAEYVVYVVKHFFDNNEYIGLEVFVRNTLEDQVGIERIHLTDSLLQLLENIDLRLGLPSHSAVSVLAQTNIPLLAFDREDSMLVLLHKNDPDTPVADCLIASQLKYTVKEDVSGIHRKRR